MKQTKKRQTKKNLETYLNKAGYDVKVNKLRKRVFHLSIAATGILWVIVLIKGILNGASTTDLLVFSSGLWTAVFLLIWLILWGLVYFFLEMRIYRRTKQLEEVLPDFLQLTSANISAGMPIDRALWLAIRPNFGVLAKEIEDVAKSTLTGEDLAEALKGLTKKYDSVMLKRSVALILEGLRAGGELAELLNKIALNIQELKIMRKEMAANVTTYAIFIGFASIVVAPVLFALATHLIRIVITIASKIDLSSVGSTMISFSPDDAMLHNFKIYCYSMLSVSAFMAGELISVIKKGNVKEGITNIPFYIIASLLIYYFSLKFLGIFLSGIA